MFSQLQKQQRLLTELSEHYVSVVPLDGELVILEVLVFTGRQRSHEAQGHKLIYFYNNVVHVVYNKLGCFPPNQATMPCSLRPLSTGTIHHTIEISHVLISL